MLIWEHLTATEILLAFQKVAMKVKKKMIFERIWTPFNDKGEHPQSGVGLEERLV